MGGGDSEKLDKARDMQEIVEHSREGVGKDVPVSPILPQPEEEVGPGEPSEKPPTVDEPIGDTNTESKPEQAEAEPEAEAEVAEKAEEVPES
ncbi:uncharacterized protein [Littorina saxatilis]